MEHRHLIIAMNNGYLRETDRAIYFVVITMEFLLFTIINNVTLRTRIATKMNARMCIEHMKNFSHEIIF